VSREVHAGICESRRVKLPPATRHPLGLPSVASVATSFRVAGGRLAVGSWRVGGPRAQPTDQPAMEGGTAPWTGICDLRWSE
jgi:hypothetical protein